MLTSDTLQKVMNSHHQKHEESCIASAFEFVAKLHELIPLESFPLQEDEKNQRQSFGHSEFLTTLKLECEHGLHDIDTAVSILEKETNEGKFPLIALIQKIKEKYSYHIYCAVLCDNQLVLVDPASPHLKAKNKEETTKVIQENSQMNPERKTLDILQYENNRDN